VLVQALVALALVLVAGQFLLTVPAARYVMSYVDRLEGVALGDDGPTITVVLVEGGSWDNAFLLVNGERASGFSGGQVRVAVAEGDLIEVDGTGLDAKAIFEIAETSGGVTAPAVGQTVVTEGGIGSFGRVECQRPAGDG